MKKLARYITSLIAGCLPLAALAKKTKHFHYTLKCAATIAATGAAVFLIYSGVAEGVAALDAAADITVELTATWADGSAVEVGAQETAIAKNAAAASLKQAATKAFVKAGAQALSTAGALINSGIDNCYS